MPEQIRITILGLCVPQQLGILYLLVMVYGQNLILMCYGHLQELPKSQYHSEGKNVHRKQRSTVLETIPVARTIPRFLEESSGEFGLMPTIDAIEAVVNTNQEMQDAPVVHSYIIPKRHTKQEKQRPCSIEMISRIPGKCENVGRIGSACVSGEYMDVFNTECMSSRFLPERT